jgi:hypothetical protein
MNKIICDAIAARLVVTFVYEGKLRSVEPHLLGASSKGVPMLSAWQLSGGSGTGWREYHCAKIASMGLTSQHFSGPRNGYNPDGGSFSSIVCCI